MTINDYTKSCLAFAHDTSNWEDLPSNQFYLTSYAGEWKETCDGDGCEIAIDVSWAFHLSDEDIIRLAPETYRSLIAELLRVAIDDGWDDMERIYELLT